MASFDLQKLAKIRANLGKEGVTFVTGDDGERLALALGGEAMYIAEPGRPGVIVLGKHPSQAAVIEELIPICAKEGNFCHSEALRRISLIDPSLRSG